MNGDIKKVIVHSYGSSTKIVFSAVYYNIDSSMPVNDTRMRQIIANVVDQSYVADDGRKLANSTLGTLIHQFFFANNNPQHVVALISNATLHRYIHARSANSSWDVKAFAEALQEVCVHG